MIRREVTKNIEKSMERKRKEKCIKIVKMIRGREVE